MTAPPTLDQLGTPVAWADAQGRILAVGTQEDLARRWPRAKRLDFGDATLIPGLIDAHGHVSGQGALLTQANLVGTRSKEEIIERLREFGKTLGEGEWLVGRGWDQNDWPEKEFPTAADLDGAFPDRPVWLYRIDGHAAWANSAAMRAVKRDLTGDWQPEGGRILRDAQGEGVRLRDVQHDAFGGGAADEHERVGAGEPRRKAALPRRHAVGIGGRGAQQGGGGVDDDLHELARLEALGCDGHDAARKKRLE